MEISRTIGALKKDRKGAALVEMVAVMGLIMICIGIIVTTGQLMINKNICMNAAFGGGPCSRGHRQCA